MDSTPARELPIEQRRIHFPLDASASPDQLFTRLSQRMASVARDPLAQKGRGIGPRGCAFRSPGLPRMKRSYASQVGARRTPRRAGRAAPARGVQPRDCTAHLERGPTAPRWPRGARLWRVQGLRRPLSTTGPALAPKVVFGLPQPKRLASRWDLGISREDPAPAASRRLTERAFPSCPRARRPRRIRRRSTQRNASGSK